MEIYKILNQEKFLENVAQNKKQEQIKLKKDLKLLEKNLITPKSIEKYHLLKNCSENIYEHITKGTNIISRCQWYEDGEKSTQFFFNPKKTQATKINIKMLENKGTKKLQSKI